MKTEDIKKSIISEANKEVHKVVAWIKLVGLIGIVVSVLLFIWIGGWVPLQITASSLFIMVIAFFIKESFDKTAGDYIDSNEVKEIRRKLGTFTDKTDKIVKRSAFQQRLDKAIEEARKNKTI